MKASRILLACLVAVAFAAPALVLRVSAETRPGSVGVAVAESVLDHWRSQGESDPAVHTALESAGVRTVVLGMPSIRSYVDDGRAEIVESGDPLVLRAPSELEAALRARFPSAVTLSRGTVRVAGVPDALDAPLGYPPAKIAALRDAGLDVMLALPAGAKDLAWLEDEISRTRVRSALVTGSVPDPALAAYLDDAGIGLAVSDFAPGGGPLTAYGERFAGRLVRAHLIELKGGDDLESLVVRARRGEKERGVRLIVLQAPPDFPGAGPSLDQAVSLATSIQRDLPPGLTAGDPTPTPAVEPSLLVRLLTVLSAVAIALLALFVLPRTPAALGIACFAVVGVAAAAFDHLVLLQLFTLATAVVGATLAVLTRSYLLGAAVTLATGLTVAGLGAQSTFMTGTTSFLGVKALLLAPPVLVACLGLRSVLPLVWPPRGWHLVLVAGLVLVAAYYLIRSGNSGLVPGFELWLRDGLDELLYVRPRFKEALLGFPALFVAARWTSDARCLWSVVAAVGTASAVDTFAHFHTPLLVALLRTGYALAIGLVLGLAVAWVLRRVRSKVAA